MLGVNIRRCLNDVGMTALDLADACGCSKSFMSYVLSGEKVPNAYMFSRMAKALGCTMEHLMAEDPSHEAAQ
ncbi:MAG: helix-turn-helix domain-containing protein [Christensenellaceae bacterium]|nr:helix-turn-helix domain-containing protein [Christensenellaceae bacterium]